MLEQSLARAGISSTAPYPACYSLGCVIASTSRTCKCGSVAECESKTCITAFTELASTPRSCPLRGVASCCSTLSTEQDEGIRTSIGYAAGLTDIELHNVNGLSDGEISDVACINVVCFTKQLQSTANGDAALTLAATCGALADALHEMTALKELELTGMTISAHCSEALATGLREAPLAALRKLGFAGSTLHAQPILDAVMTLKALQKLSLKRAVLLDTPAPEWIMRRPQITPDGQAPQFRIKTKNTIFEHGSKPTARPTTPATATESATAPRAMRGSGGGGIAPAEAAELDARIKEKEAEIQALMQQRQRHRS